MLIAGAKRHALEIYDVLKFQNINELYFFDDINTFEFNLFVNEYPVIQNIDAVKELFKINNQFILGLGGTKNRQIVAQKLLNAGGELTSIISISSTIGDYNVFFGIGLNIMNYVMISSCVSIGDGTLVNAYASIHHDVEVGTYCEISPRATLLGGCKIGDFSVIGSGAIVLPNVTIGNNVIVGAGAVVTKNVISNTVVVGVPAKTVRLAK